MVEFRRSPGVSRADIACARSAFNFHKRAGRMANEFVEDLTKSGQLKPIETAVLQAAGVRS